MTGRHLFSMANATAVLTMAFWTTFIANFSGRSLKINIQLSSVAAFKGRAQEKR